jgi:hypothetical protein
METITQIEKQLVADELSLTTSLCLVRNGNAYVAESVFTWDGAI